MSEHLVSDGYKLGDRDAMAWQVFLAKQSQPGAQGTDTEAREAYSAVDAFLYERKRQAQEGGQ